MTEFCMPTGTLFRQEEYTNRYIFENAGLPEEVIASCRTVTRTRSIGSERASRLEVPLNGYDTYDREKEK